MNKKYFFIILLFTFITSVLYSQYSADLSSQIYDDISIWEGRGYVRQLPNFRPLPETVLVDIVKQVMRKGDYVSQQKARYYFDRLSRLLITGDFFTNHYVNIVSESGKELPLRWYGSAGLEGRGFSFVASPLVSIAVGLGFKGIADKDKQGPQEIRNYFYTKKHLSKLEEIPDGIRVGSLRTIELKAGTNVRSSFTAGKPHAFMQAGFMRRSIGPFFDDGLIVSSRAPETGNIFVYWRGKKIAGTWGLFMLTSRQYYKKFNSKDDFDIGYGIKYNKAYFYNALTWYATPNIELNLWESVMFGDFNFAYLLPIKVIYAIDGLSSFVAGNLFLGLSADFRLGKTFKLPVSILIDDVNVNDVIRFRWDTKIKVAFQTGLQWTPEIPVLQKMAFNYQLVLPYTYSHSPDGSTLYSSGYNQTNHTVGNDHLATTLEPSSHRISLEAELKPIRFLDIGTAFRFSQHNNASAGILNGPLNDGSILDDGYYSLEYDGQKGASFQNRNGFLQGTIEHTIEFGLNLGVKFPITQRIDIYGDASYSLRHIINYQLIEGLNRTENVIMFNAGVNIVVN